MKLVITVEGEEQDLGCATTADELAHLFYGIDSGAVRLKYDVKYVYAKPKEENECEHISPKMVGFD